MEVEQIWLKKDTEKMYDVAMFLHGFLAGVYWEASFSS
jgi:hypothetical protein